MLRRFAISCALMVLAMPAPARTRPHYGGVLRVETAGDPMVIARRLIYDGLTRIGADGSVQPALATGWESDGDAHRWEFRLRPGVRFHDDSPLTSTAVVASLNLSCNGGCPWSAVHAVGATVVFTSDMAMPNLPALLASNEFLIELVATADGKTPGGAGAGPFRIDEIKDGALKIVANDACWQGRPFVDAIEIRGRRAVRDQWLDLSLDRVDVIDVPAEMIRQAQQQKLATVISPPVDLLALQVSESGALANPLLRAAIAASIDRSAIANVIFQRQGEATASVLPQGFSGFSFLFPVERDLNKAHALHGGLAVPTLTLAAEGDGVMQLAAQRIALDLREAGFNAVVASAATGQQPDLLLRRIALQGGKPSAVLDEALHQMREIPVGADPSPAAIYKVERTFLDQHTLIPLVSLPRAYAVGGRIRDLHLLAGGEPDLAGVSLEDAP